MHDNRIKDALGSRMKDQYESRTRFMLPRRTYTLIRVDGKAFHTYARDAEKPFDVALMNCMDSAAAALCREAQGSCVAYVQSDEISVLLTDFATDQTCAWFDGNLQKLASISASCVTAWFNLAASAMAHINGRMDWASRVALFDARAWTIPDPTEVENYFIWRQQDATRNSISMVAQSKFSHRELHGKSSAEMQEMLYQQHAINWNDLPDAQKRGRAICYTHSGRWEAIDVPVFTSPEGREWLKARIPRYV